MEQKTAEQKQKMEQRLKDWVKKINPELGVDIIDVHSEMDSSLSYEENKELLREKFKEFLPKPLKDQVAHHKAEQERLLQEKINQAEAEVAAYNEKIKYVENADLDVFYKQIHRAVEKMCKGYSNLVFVKGRGGIGKSRNIRKILTKNKADFIEVTGEVTEAYLYRLIYENNDKIIWMKDITKLLNGLGSINLLKAATETEETRILTKSNYSKQQADLPDKFVCRVKFVFDYNNLYGHSLREDFEALTTRGDFIELAMCDDEVTEIMKLIAVTPEEKEVTQFIIEQFEKTGQVRLNLRMQQKAFQTRAYADKVGLKWKDELEAELGRVTKIRALLYSLIGNKVVRTNELKQLLLKHEIVHSMTAANSKVHEWLFCEELYKWSEEERNSPVGIKPRPNKPLDTRA